MNIPIMHRIDDGVKSEGVHLPHLESCNKSVISHFGLKLQTAHVPLNSASGV